MSARAQTTGTEPAPAAQPLDAAPDAWPGVAVDGGPGAALDAGHADAGAGPADGDAGPVEGDAGPVDGDAGPAVPASGEGDAGARPAPPPARPASAGGRDAGPADAGPSDAGPMDAAPADAGVLFPAIAAEPPPTPPPTTTTAPPSLPAGAIIKVILGLSLLFILAYIGAHPRIKEFEDTIGITQLITAGFPFVALGVIARHPDIGILRDDTLAQLTPVLNFGMGWLGFIIGIQLDVRFLDRLPKGTGLLVVIEASAPFAVTAVICGGMMMLFGLDHRDPDLWRNALLLGAAGAMTATVYGSLAARPAWHDRRRLPSAGIHGLVSQLDEIVGVACLLFMAAFFRPEGSEVTWQVPGTAWVLLSLGLGVAMGMLMFVIVRTPRSGAEFLAVQLGTIAFASGLAGYLRLSPIVICFIAGVFITNFPCEQRDSLRRILARLERPIHLLFLIIAGALWDVGDWRGWVLVPCFAVARLLGRWLGITAGEKAFAAQGRALPTHGPLVTPLSVLAVALVVSVERLYRGSTISWVMTAVIGGAVLTELLVQLAPVSNRSYLDMRPDDDRPDTSGGTAAAAAIAAGDESTLSDSASSDDHDAPAARTGAAGPPDASLAPETKPAPGVHDTGGAGDGGAGDTGAGDAGDSEEGDDSDGPPDPATTAAREAELAAGVADQVDEGSPEEPGAADAGSSAEDELPAADASASALEYRTGRVRMAERRAATKAEPVNPADLPHDDQDDWGA